MLIRALLLELIAAAILILPWWYVVRQYSPNILPARSIAIRPYAIVFGAGLRRDGRPTRILSDRVRAAVALHKDGKVTKILMSGSSQGPYYDEPGAMRDMAAEMGVPMQDILVDRGGSRTFDTCLRARSEFSVESAVLVSQRFHLPRALVICDKLGIEAVGFAADGHQYRHTARGLWGLREIPATIVALWDLYFHPEI